MLKSPPPPKGAPYPSSRQVLPMLFERLTQDASEGDGDPGSAWRALHTSVRANLQSLLNCSRPAGGQPGDTVLFYGMPALAGKVVSEVGWQEIADAIKTAILHFEPRIIAAGLAINSHPLKTLSPHILSFAIQGQLWWTPEPVEFLYYSHVDLESGHFRLSDQA